MRLTVFGATGRAGSAVLEQALKAGYEVTAFVRNPSKLTIKNEHLTVVQGDATDPEAVERAVRDTDAVISAMGPWFSKNKGYTCRMQNIIDAMKKHGVKRLVITAGTTLQPNDRPNMSFKLIYSILPLLIPAIFDDLSGAMRAVKDSDTDWTIVRMGRAAYAPPTGRFKATVYMNKSSNRKTSTPRIVRVIPVT